MIALAAKAVAGQLDSRHDTGKLAQGRIDEPDIDSRAGSSPFARHFEAAKFVVQTSARNEAIVLQPPPSAFIVVSLNSRLLGLEWQVRLSSYYVVSDSLG